MRALSVSRRGAAGLVLAALAGLGLAGVALGTQAGDGGRRADLEGASARDVNQVPTSDPASANATNPKEKMGGSPPRAKASTATENGATGEEGDSPEDDSEDAPAASGSGEPPATPPEMSVEEWLKNGPKEPLVPPIIQVVAEPAPGSTMTMEPLVPPVVTVSPTAADPGAAVPSEPLVPKVIKVDVEPR